MKVKEEQIKILEKKVFEANNHSAKLMKELEATKRNLQKQHNLQVFLYLLNSFSQLNVRRVLLVVVKK